MALNLKLSWKLALIGISGTIPLLCGTYYLINRYTNKDVRFTVLEQSGNRFLRPLGALLEALPEHQALLLRSLTGDETATASLSAKQAQVDMAFAALDDMTTELGTSLQYAASDLVQQERAGLPLVRMRHDWQLLKQPASPHAVEEIGHRHAQMVAQVRALIVHIGNTSNLILDPDLDSYYLMDVTLGALPQMQDRLARIIAAGEVLLRKTDLTAGERTQLAVQASQLKESDLDRITLSLQTALATDPDFYGRSESLQRNLPPLARDLTEATEAFLAVLNQLAAAECPAASPADFVAAGARARKLSFRLAAVGSEELDRLLQRRIDDLHRARAWGLGLVALSVLLTAGVTVTVARSINHVEQQIRDLNATLEHRVVQRTAEMEAANKELESFSYSVSHDLRAPLRGIAGFTEALSRNYRTKLDADGAKYLDRVLAGTERMSQLIDDLLNLSRVGRTDFVRRPVNLSALARSIAENLQQTAPRRKVEWIIEDGMIVEGDSRLLRVVLENLLGNAWKFTTKQPAARIEFGFTPGPSGCVTCHVRDNGAGFDMAYAAKLFNPFQRLHGLNEFPGTGIGLATVKRIIQRHGGQVRAEAKVDAGATLYFSL